MVRDRRKLTKTSINLADVLRLTLTIVFIEIKKDILCVFLCLIAQIYYWHCPHSMRSKVCETVQCPSLCLSVCLSQHGPAAGPAAGDIDRLLHGALQQGVRRANAGSATMSAYVVAEHRLVKYL